MGIRISAQLLLFAQSILLGLSGGAVYGALRPLRRLRPGLAPALDLLYALSAAAAGTAFLLRPADGILRGYAVLGALGGAALWLCGFDDAVRPLWTFWTETAALLVSLALLPVRLTARFLRFLLESGESLFYFVEKCCTIKAGFRRPRRAGAHTRRNAGSSRGAAAGQNRQTGRTSDPGRAQSAGQRGGTDRNGRRSGTGRAQSAGRRTADRAARRNGQRTDRKRNGQRTDQKRNGQRPDGQGKQRKRRRST